MTLLFWLLVSHAVCDYPLQGDFLARAKNHRAALPGVPWWQALVWHSLIHAGGVALVFTYFGVPHAVAWGIAECSAHIMIDFAKCEGWTGFNADQALHVGCKAAYAAVLCYA